LATFYVKVLRYIAHRDPWNSSVFVSLPIQVRAIIAAMVPIRNRANQNITEIPGCASSHPISYFRITTTGESAVGQFLKNFTAPAKLSWLTTSELFSKVERILQPLEHFRDVILASAQRLNTSFHRRPTFFFSDRRSHVQSSFSSRDNCTVIRYIPFFFFFFFFLLCPERPQNDAAGGGFYWASLRADGSPSPYRRGIARKLSKSIKLPPTTHLRDFRIRYLPCRMKRSGMRYRYPWSGGKIEREGGENRFISWESRVEAGQIGIIIVEFLS